MSEVDRDGTAFASAAVPEAVPPADRSVRLQRVLAAAGCGSRRKCEVLIAAGRVQVDGVIIDRLGTRIDPHTAVVHVDGSRLVVSPVHAVVALNKPVGYLTAMSDDRGRRCVGDLVRDSEATAEVAGGLFHVGRLDADTEGLLLLTNDGDLAHRLTHPSFGVAKTYVAQVSPVFTAAALRKLTRGLVIEGRPLAITGAKIVSEHRDRSVVSLSIHEGRNRIVRRAFAELGFEVTRLVRTEFGPIRLGRMKPAALRRLDPSELDALYAAVEHQPEDRPGAGTRSRTM